MSWATPLAVSLGQASKAQVLSGQPSWNKKRVARSVGSPTSLSLPRGQLPGTLKPYAARSVRSDAPVFRWSGQSVYDT